MLRKLLSGLVASILLFTPMVAAAEPGPSGYFINTMLIKRLLCKTDDGISAGTAFLIGDHKLMTASHVVHNATCVTDGQLVSEVFGLGYRIEGGNPIKVISDNTAGDYALIESTDTNKQDESLNFSCEGFKKNQVYMGVGWALGLDLVVQRLVGSPSIESEEGFSGEVRLIGNNFHGMSGGPIFDDRGFVVGIVNAGDQNGRAMALSRALRDTSICR